MDKMFLAECMKKGMSIREISNICNLAKSTVFYWIRKYNLSDQLKYKKNGNYKFEKIDSREKAYSLGFILADGSITNSNTEIATCMKDKIVVEFISRVVHGNVTYSHNYDKKKGIFPKARLIKKITDITKFTGGRLKKDRHYPIVQKDLERFLIQGLFDADGCITWGIRKDRNRIWQKVSFTSQLKILEGVQKYLIKKLDISTTLRPKSNENCYVLEFANKKDVLKFCEHIYPNEDFIILKRKYLKYKALRLELEENGEGTEK